MVLADTSVWIDHLRKGNRRLIDLLADGQVLIHPFIVGELACGNLRNRDRLLQDLQTLERARTATHEEVLGLVEDRKLWAKGIGWMDAHLLASALLSRAELWTLDRRLDRAAKSLNAT